MSTTRVVSYGEALYAQFGHIQLFDSFQNWAMFEL
jgi:hypothetical protein